MQRRLVFVSRYRGFLSVLVVLFHAGVTYGAAGSWYYVEHNDLRWLSTLTDFLAFVTRSFVPGAFFFLSAYFLPGSLEDRGTGRFLRARCVRLLIPLGLYSFIANPLLVMAAASWGRDSAPPGLRFGVGPLWFVAALSVFVLVYLGWRQLFPDAATRKTPAGMPSSAWILLTILVFAALAFLVRAFLPTLSDFPAYIILFAVGIRAGQERWLEDVASLPIGLWAAVAGAGLLAFPVLGAVAPQEAAFPWLSAARCAWQAATGMALFIVTLVMFSRARWVIPGTGESFSSSSYAIYLLHPVVVVLCALAMRNLALHPVLKWVTVSAFGVCLPWAASAALRKITGFPRAF